MDNSWQFSTGYNDMSQSSMNYNCTGQGSSNPYSHIPQGSMPFTEMLNQPMGVHMYGSPPEETPQPSHKPSGSKIKKAATKLKQNNFSADEDKILVSCWLNSSLDPITGAGQRKASFWRAIVTDYNAQKPADCPTRTKRSLEGRWAYIKEQTSKFESHYQNILSENQSGYHHTNTVAAAIDRHNSLEKKPMNTMHCWRRLRNEPKWLDLQQQNVGGRGGPVDLTEDDETTEEGTESQTRPLKRPIGREAAKAAKKSASGGTGSHSSAEYSSMFSELNIQRQTFWKEVEGVVATKIDKLVEVTEESIKQKKERDERLVELREREVRLSEMKEHERIMAIDLSTCTPTQRALYEALQKEILERMTSKSG